MRSLLLKTLILLPAIALSTNATASYHHYKGSLTTPPCSEGVNWFGMSNPIEASMAQIDRLSKIMGNNARPPQPLNQFLLISGR